MKEIRIINNKHMDIKKILQQAQENIDAAVVLGIAVYRGQIEVSAEEMLEVYYLLWKWNKRLPDKPKALVEILRKYDEIFENCRQDLNLYLESRERLEKQSDSDAKQQKMHQPTSREKIPAQKMFMFFNPNQIPS